MPEPQNPTNVNQSVVEQTASLQPDAGTQDFKPGPPLPERSIAANVQVPGYRMLGVLGRGGMGVVYKAVQEKADRLVALKMILAGAHADQHDRTRFHVEASAAARMSHPNIVQLYEVGETPDGFPFFSLEYVSGGTLSERLKQGPLRPLEAAALVEKLARAMQYAHERGIVHRDLKPLNILLEGGRSQESGGKGQGSSGDDRKDTMIKDIGARTLNRPDLSTARSGSSLTCEARTLTPKISDFGLAKQLDSEDGLTRTGAIMGSPAYMAPEQAFGQSKNVGPAADIYALGAILYECLTGRPPFKGATIADTLEQVRTMEPITLKAFAKEIPADLETICLHCLHKEPQRRYASADALADDLRRYQEHKPITVRPVGNLERTRRWCRRNPGIASMIAVVAVSLVFVAVFSSAMYVNAEYERKEAVKAREDADTKKKEAEEARDDAKKKKELAETRKEQADQAVGLFATDARQYCDDAMVPEESRKKLYEVLIKQLEKQADQAAGEATIDALRNKAFMYQTLAAVNFDFRKQDASQKWCAKGLVAVTQWEKIKPGDHDALTFRAKLLNLRGDSLTAEKKLDSAKGPYQEALEIRRKLVGDPDIELPKKVDAISQLADSLDSLERFEESIELREKICTIFKKEAQIGENFKATRAVSFPYREALCWTYQKAGFHATDYETRKKYLVKADEMSNELMGRRNTPRNILLRWSFVLKILGELEDNYGKLAEKDRKIEEAEKYFEAAAGWYTKHKGITHRLATSDELIDGLREYARSFYTLGLAEKRKGDQGDSKLAREHFQRSWEIRNRTFLDYGSTAISSHLLIDMWFSQLAVGELKVTMKAADSMIFTFTKEPDAEYRLACIYALAITTLAENRRPKPLTELDKREQDRYLLQAFQCLQLAHDGGFTDFFQSNVDADLETLRDDPAMKEFEVTHQYRLAVLEMKKGKAGDAKKARAHFQKAQDLAEQFMKALPKDSRYRHVKAAWLCTRVQLGQHAEVIKEAGDLGAKDRDSAVSFMLARVYSLASTKTDDSILQEQYRTQAIEALQKATIPGGILTPVIVTEARLVEEDDLDPIRGDERFKKILEQAKKQAR